LQALRIEEGGSRFLVYWLERKEPSGPIVERVRRRDVPNVVKASRETGIPQNTIRHRLRTGMTFDEAVSKPVGFRRIQVTVEGVEYRSKAEARRALGWSQKQLERYLKTGKGPADRSVEVGGVRYPTKAAARRELGWSQKRLDAALEGRALSKSQGIPVSLDGVDYPTKAAACRALGVSAFRLEKLLRGEDPPEKEVIVWGGVRYDSLAACARALGVSLGKMTTLIGGRRFRERLMLDKALGK